MGDHADDSIYGYEDDDYWDGYERELEDPIDLPRRGRRMSYESDLHDLLDDYDDEPHEFVHDGIINETDLAVCCKIGGGFITKTVWLPKSQIEIIKSKKNTILVPSWLMIEKELL